jgi:hypothetical protein
VLGAEVTQSGFDVTPIVVVPRAGGGLAEPAAGASSNAQGDVLFALVENGKDVLYLRFANGMRVRLLGAGDPLAGSRVARVVASPTSLDAHRQILVYAELEDGRAGLFRLSPPPSPFAVTPKWGYRDRPVSFHLTGDGFTPGVEVYFGDVKAGFVTAISRTELTGVLPATDTSGTVEVSVSRPGGARRSLKEPFEFRDPPKAGCQGLFPDHRPPVKTSLPAASWLAVAAILALRQRRG